MNQDTALRIRNACSFCLVISAWIVATQAGQVQGKLQVIIVLLLRVCDSACACVCVRVCACQCVLEIVEHSKRFVNATLTSFVCVARFECIGQLVYLVVAIGEPLNNPDFELNAS